MQSAVGPCPGRLLLVFCGNTRLCSLVIGTPSNCAFSLLARCLSYYIPACLSACLLGPGCELAGELASTVERLKLERRQLLQHLQDANTQICDLHQELGPAVLKGCCASSSPSRAGRRATSAARAAAACGKESEALAAAAATADLGRADGGWWLGG